jgi:3D (Asp-Asp-Asp) domain-containing protein
MGRDTTPAAMVATGVLSLGLLAPLSAASASQSDPGPAVLDPHAATAESRAEETTSRAPVAVNLVQRGGAPAHVFSAAPTVGAFLQERGIAVAAGDFVSPGPDVALSDGMTVEYRPAVEVTVIVGKERRSLRSTAPTVAALLRGEGIRLGPHDKIYLRLTDRLSAGTLIRVVRVAAWTAKIRQRIAATLESRFDSALRPGTARVIARGRSGERELTVKYTQTGGARPVHAVVASRILRAPRPRIVAKGIGEYAAFARLAQRGFEGTIHLARSAMSMLASAYTARCAGCSGWTAIGAHAGHGIVAVDPSVIPLGTRLFIPGYGRAIAGDTGGAIRGRRIDLGFNSLTDALRFGRRRVKVYVLR